MTQWEGDILSYKDHLKAKVMKEAKKNAKSNPILNIDLYIYLSNFRPGSGPSSGSAW